MNDDWRWQLRNRLTTLADLEGAFELTPDERAAVETLAPRFELGITPYYASLISDDPDDPIRKQAIPSLAEGIVAPGEVPDPLGEEAHEVAPGLVRRYPDRALLFTSPTCAVYCRHCTRRRKVGVPSEAIGSFEPALAWLAHHPEVDDVILSGGDALSLGDEALDRLLGALRALPHAVTVRIGTRHPVTLPMRVTPELCAVLARHGPVRILTHFNHPRECTEQAAAAVSRLVRAGCPVHNQTVLLAGVNDDAAVLLELNRWLVRHGATPYRLYPCDLVEGTSHFRTGLDAAVAIERELRRIGGIAVPELVLDLAGAGGKVRVVEGERLADRWRFRSYEGDWVEVWDDGRPAGSGLP